LQDINSVADAGQAGLDNRLTASGLSTSPIAGFANLKQQLATKAARNRFLTVDAPAYGTQLGQTMLATAPRSEPGSAAGAGFGTAAELLAYLYGSGHFGGGKPGSTDANAAGVNW